MKQAVSLVLSSGGARGIAHIGVIEELERHGFEIKSVAGTSMGSLVGGIYASGNLPVYREWMCNLDRKAVFSLFDFTISKNGLVKGSKVIRELKKIVADVTIENLPVSFTAVATDIRNKQEVVFEKGSLYEAIRASISIPTVLIPIMLEEMILIDGGILNPLPLNRVKRTENDLLVAVDLNTYLPPEKDTMDKKDEEPGDNGSAILSFFRNKGIQFFPKTPGNQLNYYSLLTQSHGLMLQQLTALAIELYQPDILVRIPRNSYATFDFYKAGEIINNGVLATQQALLNYRLKQ